MVTPAASREAVANPKASLKVSGRRACSIIAADRSAVRYLERPIRHDERRYEYHWRIEAMFCRLEDFRRFATRCDKLARNFLSTVHLAAAVACWLRSNLDPGLSRLSPMNGSDANRSCALQENPAAAGWGERFREGKWRRGWGRKTIFSTISI